jgi:hypothetical protein
MGHVGKMRPLCRVVNVASVTRGVAAERASRGWVSPLEWFSSDS